MLSKPRFLFERGFCLILCQKMCLFASEIDQTCHPSPRQHGSPAPYTAGGTLTTMKSTSFLREGIIGGT